MRAQSPDAPKLDGPPRLLLLSPFAPRPDASMGGPVVIAGLITALGHRERVGLLYLRGCAEPPLDPRVASACEFAIEVPRMNAVNAGSGLRAAQFSALAALRSTPRWVAEWNAAEYALRLKSVISEWRPHIIQAEFHIMAQYLGCAREAGIPSLLTQHEPGAAAFADRRRAGLVDGKLMPVLEERAWRKYERRLLQQVDAVVTFTERDRDAVRRLDSRARVEVIAPGARIPEQPFSPVGYGRPALLFFGNYVHSPNVDAALRLGRDIYPRLRATVPDAVLWLPGDRPSPEMQALASESIKVPGRAADLSPYLDSAALVIAPLRIGGGMRVKVIETLAAGKALVASALAVAGLDVVDREHYLAAETDEEFAAAALWLLEHPAERARLGAQARAWALDNLSWDRAAERYLALHQDLLARHHAVRSDAKSRG